VLSPLSLSDEARAHPGAQLLARNRDGPQLRFGDTPERDGFSSYSALLMEHPLSRPF
jgi:hypothetical protein